MIQRDVFSHEADSRVTDEMHRDAAMTGGGYFSLLVFDTVRMSSKGGYSWLWCRNELHAEVVEHGAAHVKRSGARGHVALRKQWGPAE